MSVTFRRLRSIAQRRTLDDERPEQLTMGTTAIEDARVSSNARHNMDHERTEVDLGPECFMVVAAQYHPLRNSYPKTRYAFVVRPMDQSL